MALLALLEIAALLSAPVQPRSGPCGMLTATDMMPLLGAEPQPTDEPCLWKSKEGFNRVVIMLSSFRGSRASAMYNDTRKSVGADPDANVTDELGFGDRALSAMTPFGVVVVMMKGDQLVQMQYWVGGKPDKAAAVSLLRPLAARVLAAL